MKILSDRQLDVINRRRVGYVIPKEGERRVANILLQEEIRRVNSLLGKDVVRFSDLKYGAAITIGKNNPPMLFSEGPAVVKTLILMRMLTEEIKSK